MSETLSTILVSAGIAFVAAAILGGGLRAFQIDIPLIAGRSRQVLLGVFGLLLIAAVVLPGTESPGDALPDVQSPMQAENGKAAPPFSAQPGPSEQPPVPGPAPASGQPRETEVAGADAPTPLAACVLAIDQPLVPLRREPRQFSRELMRIPPGRYDAQEYVVERFGPTEHGWFSVVVEGRSGWVKDDTWGIAEKSGTCPG